MPAAEEHLGERAELYALGDLDAPDARRVDDHAARCAACARRLGEAEAAVAALIAAGADAGEAGLGPAPVFVSRAAPRRASAVVARYGALAAAFVIGMIAWAIPTSLSHRAPPAPEGVASTAASAMLAGHFFHVPFASREPGAPAAKAIYPREGGWLLVLVGPHASPLDVAIADGAARRVVATIPAGVQARSVFVERVGRPQRIELLRNRTVVASAEPAYRR